jgi:hypothetical protein
MKKTTKKFMAFVESIAGENKELLESVKAGYKTLHEGISTVSVIESNNELTDIIVEIDDICALMDISIDDMKRKLYTNIVDYRGGIEEDVNNMYNNILRIFEDDSISIHISIELDNVTGDDLSSYSKNSVDADISIPSGKVITIIGEGGEGELSDISLMFNEAEVEKLISLIKTDVLTDNILSENIIEYFINNPDYDEDYRTVEGY